MRSDFNFILVARFVLTGLLFCLFSPNDGFASSGNESVFPIRSNGPIKFDLDLCQFEGEGDSTRIEIYYSVYLAGVDTTKGTRNNRSILEIFVKIRSDTGNILYQVHDEKTINFSEASQSGQKTTFIDIKSFNLHTDSITVQLTIQDRETGDTGKVITPVKVRKFENRFSLSDLYFISHVQKATGSSVFERHGVMLVPHPSRTFFIRDDAKKVFVFYEINHLTFDTSKQSFYDVFTQVYDIKGKEVFKSIKELIKVGSTNSSRIEVIPVGNFKNGIYKILIQVLDRDSGDREEIARLFKILREDSEETDILPMSDEEAEIYYDQIKYIATDKELDIYEQLNPQGKQKFLLQFWKSRDPNPNTIENEFMLEHFRRIAYVEGKFKGGINSDMGRIYIKYGPPFEIERQISSTDISQEIEFWNYAVDNRAQFIFVDRNGDGKFALVHSTHEDEFSNPRWQQDL
jgi:GWxTD domain-containing protein